MKIKPSFLATSILAVSTYSHAGFTPIDDDQLSAITGQAGVTIEPIIHAEIGSVVYTDEGSIGVNDIVFGGANKTSYFGKPSADLGPGVSSGNALDGAKIKIDVLDDGDIKIVGAPNAFGGLIDFKVSTGSIELINANGLNSATLIDSVSMTGLLTGFTAKIDADTLHTKIGLSVGIDDLDIDISQLGIRVENAFIVSSNYFEELAFQDGVAGDVRLLNLTADFDIDVYADDDGLHIDTLNAEFDMGIGAVIIADASIGSFALDNVNLSNIAVTISGHP